MNLYHTDIGTNVLVGSKNNRDTGKVEIARHLIKTSLFEPDPQIKHTFKDT